jgi:hypothetical protein
MIIYISTTCEDLVKMKFKHQDCVTRKDKSLDLKLKNYICADVVALRLEIARVCMNKLTNIRGSFVDYLLEYRIIHVVDKDVNMYNKYASYYGGIYKNCSLYRFAKDMINVNYVFADAFVNLLVCVSDLLTGVLAISTGSVDEDFSSLSSIMCNYEFHSDMLGQNIIAQDNRLDINNCIQKLECLFKNFICTLKDNKSYNKIKDLFNFIKFNIDRVSRCVLREKIFDSLSFFDDLLIDMLCMDCDCKRFSVDISYVNFCEFIELIVALLNTWNESIVFDEFAEINKLESLLYISPRKNSVSDGETDISTDISSPNTSFGSDGDISFDGGDDDSWSDIVKEFDLSLDEDLKNIAIDFAFNLCNSMSGEFNCLEKFGIYVINSEECDLSKGMDNLIDESTLVIKDGSFDISRFLSLMIIMSNVSKLTSCELISKFGEIFDNSNIWSPFMRLLWFDYMDYLFNELKSKVRYKDGCMLENYSSLESMRAFISYIEFTLFKGGIS